MYQVHAGWDDRCVLARTVGTSRVWVLGAGASWTWDRAGWIVGAVLFSAPDGPDSGATMQAGPVGSMILRWWQV